MRDSRACPFYSFFVRLCAFVSSWFVQPTTDNCPWKAAMCQPAAAIPLLNLAAVGRLLRMGKQLAPQGERRRLKIWSALLIILSLLAVAGLATVAVRDYSLTRTRRTVLEPYRGRDGFRVVLKCERPESPRAQKITEVSWLRQLFGDRAVLLILIPYRDATEEELARVRAAFPEAVVPSSPLSKP